MSDIPSMKVKLPKIDVVNYTLEIPSTKKELLYRPFLVKEEKILLQATQQNNEKDTIRAITQIINNCILTEDFNVDELTLFDLEYIFLQLRAKSIGEVIELTLSHPNNKNKSGEECTGVFPYELNVDDIEVCFNEKNNNVIKLSDTMGVKLKYPSYKLLPKLTKIKEDNFDSILDVILNCVDYIYDGDNVYYAKDISKSELSEFFMNFNTKQFQEVQTFFETLPIIRKEIIYTCPKCGEEEKIVLEGLQNFFT